MHSRCPVRVMGCLREYVGITTGVPPIAADLLHRLSWQSRATTRHGDYHFPFPSGFATLRAASTKSCATGLSVRFFSVTIPLGTRAIGSSTGKTLSSGRQREYLNAEVAKIVRKCPVANRLIRTSSGMLTTVVRG